jgi:hypothetical protein
MRLLSAAWLAFAAAALAAPAAHAEVRVAATSPVKLAPSSSAYSTGQCIGGMRRLAPTSRRPGEVLWPLGEPRDIVLTRIALFDPLDPDQHVRGAADGLKLLFQGAPSGVYTDAGAVVNWIESTKRQAAQAEAITPHGEATKDGSYEAPIEGEWVPVPAGSGPA